MTPAQATVLSAQLAALSRQVEEHDTRHHEDMADVKGRLAELAELGRKHNGRLTTLEAWQIRVETTAQNARHVLSPALTLAVGVCVGLGVHWLT